ncbi:MAG: tetratricopeptide repeat protein [Caldilineaceae bacterium]
MRVGDDPDTALDALAKAPTAEALFNRIWRRLRSEERTLLQQLAVFRSPSPGDAWQEQQEALEQLQQRELVRFDAIGGVHCSTHLHRWISAQIPAEQRPILHARAADIREARAEFVGAIYHAIAGRQFARAVWLWFVHREQEIDQGRGALALGLLQQISPAELPDEQDRTALRLARAELLRLAGRAEEAEQELQLMVTPPQSNLRAYADWHHGYVAEMQGRIEQALQKYRAALDTFIGLPRHNEIVIHNQLAFLHLYRQHNPKAAREQALLARAKAEAFLGDIEAMAGNYEAALAYLLSAKESTEHHSYDLRTLSRIYSYLGVVYIKLGEYDKALLYIDQAIDCDHKRGDQVGPLYDLLNRAAAYTLAGDYAQGLQDAQHGLTMAERLKNSYLIAGLAAGVAEAYFGLQQWEMAEQHAFYSLQQEEEFFRAAALVVLGMLRQKQGKYAEGVGLLTEALDNVKLLQDLYTEASVWRSIGIVHRNEQETGLAQLAFETALQLYIRLKLSKEVTKTQELLRTCETVI